MFRAKNEIPLAIEQAFGVRGQAVIVTGAGGWIGHKIAEAFAVNGARVALSDQTHPDFDQNVKRLEQHGAIGVRADLVSIEDLKNLVTKTVEAFGRLDAVIHCGAIASSAPTAVGPDEDFDRIYHTNLRSAWILARAAVPHLEKTQGCIVNISSVNGHRPMFAGPLYTASKSALINMTQEFAVEFGAKGIRANTVSPGTISAYPRFPERLRNSLAPEYFAVYEKMVWDHADDIGANGQPLNRGGRPVDIAMACIYLCSPAARFVTGADLLVDGGFVHQFNHFRQAENFWAKVGDYLKSLPPEAWIGPVPEWLKKRLSS